MVPGRPKTALPITPLTTAAARSFRPMARTSPGAGAAGGMADYGPGQGKRG